MKLAIEFVNFIVIVSVTTVYSEYLDCECEVGKLEFVSVLFRHGDKTPDEFYRNDPYKNMLYWPEGVGQLTNIGKLQEFELGQWLRLRYDSLLGEYYHPDVIYVQSTDVDRTLMSAQCVLAGMYPPKGMQVWNYYLEWQPIPVHTVPGKLDNFFTGFAPCPAYDVEFKKLLESHDIQKLNNKFCDVYKVLNENTGEQVYDLVNMSSIYDTLSVEHFNNLPLPKWARNVYPHPMQEAAKYQFTFESRTRKLARFKAGLMIKSMIDDMKAKKKGDSRNVHLYSGHEHTVATLMNALGIFDLHIPPYAACLMVELRVRPTGDHVLTIFYRNSTLEEPHLLTIPGCASACPLKEFISITKPLAISPEEWSEECRLK